MLGSFVTALSLLAASVNAALPTISAEGNKFFDSNGNQFFIKGVAYQLLPDDPLVSTQQCQTDAALMQSLGANAIRVYHVNPWANHDGCMAAFDAAGIYAFIDLDTFNTTVVQNSPQWTPEQFQAYAFVMDVFSKYDNVAGFYIGNEIINAEGANTESAPYIKASLTDLKAYQAAQGYRTIPIGYSHADVAGLRPALQNYFTCGPKAESLDFFSLNCYEWCGNVDYQTSGYATLQNESVGFPVPLFISETGCNVPEPRTFGDQAAIFGPMSGTWSGSIIYEWIQEDNHYGLITYGGGNTDALNSAAPAGGYSRSGTPTPVTPDFYNLESAWKTVTPATSVSSAAYTPSGLTTPSCPAYTAGVWQVSGDVPLPTLGVKAVSSISYSASPMSSASVPASITSAASSAKSSANSVRSSLQSTGTASAASASSAASSSSSKGAAAGPMGANTGLSGLILGLLMLF